MNTKRPFIPSFLHKIDDSLLYHKPATWASRIHLVLYYVLIFSFVIAVFSFFVFNDATQYTSLEIITSFVALIAFIGIVFWLIFLLRFNVFKRFSNWHYWEGLTMFLLYFAAVGSIVAITYIPSAVETFRANRQFGNDEIVNDINELNQNICKLEYNLLPLKWNTDTCDVIKKKKVAETAKADSVASAVADKVNSEEREDAYPPKHSVIDKVELQTKLINADSVKKINDSTYIFYECPDYIFVSNYNADKYAAVKSLKSVNIYYACVKNYKKPDRQALQKRMDYFKEKYAASRYLYSRYDNADSKNFREIIDKKYNNYYINNGIDNCVRKKYRWLDDWDSFLRIFYYVALAVSLLVFVFRHTSVKTFFLTLLTTVVLTIFTSIMLIMTSSDFIGMLSFVIVYFIIFGAIALAPSGIRTAFQGIAINIFLYLTPLLPLIITSLYFEIMLRKNDNRFYSGIVEEDSYFYRHYYYIGAEILGGVLLLILIEPLFRKLYRKWYSLPED